MKSAKILAPFAFASALLVSVPFTHAQVNTAREIAPGVFFHEGDGKRGHCNNGWITFRDYVLVIDANYPSGALEIMPKIAASTDKPVRFVFDTHHHADHAYANLLWVEKGAVVLATAGMLDEMRRVETGFFDDAPGRFEERAKQRPDVAATKLSPPTMTFTGSLVFEDKTRRLELLRLGVAAHTRGDGFAWLPNEKILFTGDACVNGPHNAVFDADIGEWIKTLQAVQKLGATIVCPGHGPMGGAEIITDQLNFFIALSAQVKALHDAGKTPAEVKASVEAISVALKKDEHIARYVGGGLATQVQKVFVELGGQPFPQ
jgi:glyoxylase-like metal-dependent hydrolase (beta-lactamase superfamily II)